MEDPDIQKAAAASGERDELCRNCGPQSTTLRIAKLKGEGVEADVGRKSADLCAVHACTGRSSVCQGGVVWECCVPEANGLNTDLAGEDDISSIGYSFAGSGLRVPTGDLRIDFSPDTLVTCRSTPFDICLHLWSPVVSFDRRRRILRWPEQRDEWTLPATRSLSNTEYSPPNQTFTVELIGPDLPPTLSSNIPFASVSAESDHSEIDTSAIGDRI
jgi:hypothetical protein